MLKLKMPKVLKTAKDFLKKYNFLSFDGALFTALAAILIIHYFGVFPVEIDDAVLIVISALALLPVLKNTFKSLKEKIIGIDLLASIALIFSLIAKEWASAVFINLMLTSARILGDFTESRSRKAIKNLLKLKPKMARLKIGDEIKKISISQIKKGDLVIVELGETIPVDGIVVEGKAEIDQSSLTGESLPIEKKAGDQAFSATIIISGNIVIKTEKIGKETTLEKIIQLVEQAAAHKPRITTMANVFTSWYVVIMLASSVVIYLISHNLALVLAVVLVVCADDISVAIPLAFIASIGHAARRGVIIKGGDILEGLNKAKVAVVDKTGTLTFGKLRVDNFFAFENFDRKEILSFAGSASKLSNHPYSKAVLNYVEKQKIALKPLDEFEEESGLGAKAVLNGKKIFIGKPAFMQKQGIKISGRQSSDIEREKNNNFNTTLIACNDKLAGFFTLVDEIRPNAKEAISELKNLGIEKLVMLTGDNEKTAERIAKETGITEYHANLLPEDKLKYLKKYINPDYKVLAIGDGVNDAAILNAADIGIAMGGIGADIAVESGDIVLIQDNLSRIPETMRLAKFTRRIAKQNFIIWALTNSIGLYIVFSGLIPPIFLPTAASAYNFITDFVPIINSIRLFRLHQQKNKNKHQAIPA